MPELKPTHPWRRNYPSHEPLTLQGRTGATLTVGDRVHVDARDHDPEYSYEGTIIGISQCKKTIRVRSMRNVEWDVFARQVTSREPALPPAETQADKGYNKAQKKKEHTL